MRRCLFWDFSLRILSFEKVIHRVQLIKLTFVTLCDIFFFRIGEVGSSEPAFSFWWLFFDWGLFLIEVKELFQAPFFV